jgi:hypothetical protein
MTDSIDTLVIVCMDYRMNEDPELTKLMENGNAVLLRAAEASVKALKSSIKKLIMENKNMKNFVVIAHKDCGGVATAWKINKEWKKAKSEKVQEVYEEYGSLVENEKEKKDFEAKNQHIQLDRLKSIVKEAFNELGRGGDFDKVTFKSMNRDVAAKNAEKHVLVIAPEQYVSFEEFAKMHPEIKLEHSYILNAMDPREVMVYADLALTELGIERIQVVVPEGGRGKAFGDFVETLKKQDFVKEIEKRNMEKGVKTEVVSKVTEKRRSVSKA